MESESYLNLFQILPSADQGFQSPLVIGALCLIFILTIVSAILSGSESAFFSLSSDHIAKLGGMNSKQSEKVIRLLSQPEELLATVMIGNTFINLLIVFLSAFLLNIFPAFSLSRLSGIGLQVLIISSFLLIFGKMLPRIYAHHRALGFALFSVNTLFFARKVFSPLRFLLLSLTSLINKKLLHNTGNMSIDELSEALDQNKNVITEDRKILQGIVNFSNIEVSDIMKPRMDVVAIDIEFDFNKLIQVINDSGYSRIPVFIETFDTIKGIIYVKDLLPYIGENESFKWQNLIRPGYYVPETKKIKDLLQEFLDKKIHMAIVVDEYGGTDGIVTLEDILEEIVGEITDESDEVETFYSRIDDFNFIFDGKILLNDFFKIVELPEELFDSIRGDADTLAGLILEIKGEIPPVNETINLKNYSFTILSVDERRIKKVRFTLDKTLKSK